MLSKNKRYLIYVLIALVYIVKFVIYRFLTDSDEGLNVWEITGVYALIIGVSALLALVGQLRGKIVLSIITMLIVDIWLITNILYYDANAMYINWQVIRFAGNLRGFEESIIVYFNFGQVLIFIPTIVLAICLSCKRKALISSEKIENKVITCLIVGSVLICCLGEGLIRDGENNVIEGDISEWSIRDEETHLFKIHSPIGHAGIVIWDALTEQFWKTKSIMPMTTEEENLLRNIYVDSLSFIPLPYYSLNGHLIFVLVESFESWSIQAKDANGVDVCENLKKYIHTHPVLFCPNIVSQQKYGRSGDGQLITQTGMLPLSSGVTCMSHGDNIYPNFAHFYLKSVILNPFPRVWNQHVTTKSYGYKRLREPDRILHGNDSLIFKWAREELEGVKIPTCVLAITINTHAPFTSSPKELYFGSEYSSIEANYLQCVHYMDKQLGKFLAWADTASNMSNATIVITADHNHFPTRNGKGTCPLIIRSPRINNSILISKGYQMDIFPTTLYALGQEDYGWKGFGVNLMDTTIKRTISPHQAYSLSDKMIRMNYFKNKRSQPE